MRATVLERESWRDWWLLAAAGLASGLLHLAVAGGASRIEPRAAQPPVWVEMTVAVVESPPELSTPEPEPQPQPQPQPVRAEPEVVEYTPQPEPPPPPQQAAKPVPRVVQGLSNSSFLEGSGTGLSVRHGTTTATRATQDTLDLGEEASFSIVPFASATTPPKRRYTPALEIPEEVVAAEVQGRVEVVLTIDAEGTVIEVDVVGPLHPAADAACVSTMKKSRWKPGTKDDVPVTVKGVPYSCRFQMSPG